MDLNDRNRIPRVLIAKIGLDGHNRGSHVVAHGLREAGMEVIYTGIRQTPSAVAKTAVQESVDVIGISSMVGAHHSIMKKLINELESLNASDIPVLLGGIIPEEDYEKLLALGVNRIFPPGAEIREIVQHIHSVVHMTSYVPEVPGSLIGRDLDELHLIGSQCEQCNRSYFPSRKNCPQCLDGRPLKQIRLPGTGILQTFVSSSVAPPGYAVPHTQGYIDLSEGGPRIFSLLTDFGDGSTLKAGLQMEMKIVKLGRDEENRVRVGYRFRPIQREN